MKYISASVVFFLLFSCLFAPYAGADEREARLELARTALRQTDGLSPSRVKILQEMLSLSTIVSALWQQYGKGVSLLNSLEKDLDPQDRAIGLTMTSEIDVASQIANSTFYLFYLQDSFGEPTPASTDILVNYCRYSEEKLLDVAGGMKIFLGRAKNEQLKEFIGTSLKDVELCAGIVARLSSCLKATPGTRTGN